MEKVSIKFSNKNGNILPEDLSLKKMTEGLRTLIKEGALKGKLDDILLDYNYDPETGTCTAILDKESLIKPDAISSVNGSLSIMMDDSVTLSDKGFSISTIKERLRLSAMDPRMKFRYTILDYKRGYKALRPKMDKHPDIYRNLVSLFRIDMMGIFNEILPHIQEGKQLQQLTGLTNITTGLNTISRDLSLSYRRALKQSTNGQISKSVFTKLQSQYNQFMTVLTNQVLPPIGTSEGSIEQGSDESKEFSEMIGSKSVSTVSITTGNPEELTKLLNKLRDLSIDNSFITVTLNSDNYTNTFGLDLSDLINNIITSTESHQSYIHVSDGRIKLF